MSGKTKKRSNSKNRHDIEYVDSFKPMIDDLTDEPKTKEKFKFKAKNPKQQRAWENLHDNLVNFLIGEVGSGKTYLAVAYAVKMLQEKKVKKVVLLRPATVNSLENIGYLKGTLDDKVAPLVIPMIAIFEELLGKELVEEYCKRGIIQPYSIAYIEGLTYKKSIVLVDEYQNTSSEMLRAILTRIDDTSQCIVMGDEHQIKLDNPMISASKDVARFKDKKGIGFIEFNDNEIVRGKITELIESCYDKKLKVNFKIEPKEENKVVLDNSSISLIDWDKYEEISPSQFAFNNIQKDIRNIERLLEDAFSKNDVDKVTEYTNTLKELKYNFKEIQDLVEEERNKYNGISEGFLYGGESTLDSNLEINRESLGLNFKSVDNQFDPIELKDVLPKEEYDKIKDLKIYGVETKIDFPNTSYNAEDGV